jgi:hypothetical protein
MEKNNMTLGDLFSFLPDLLYLLKDIFLFSLETLVLSCVRLVYVFSGIWILQIFLFYLREKKKRNNGVARSASIV